MPFPYKRVLVIGATSGIGEALASKIIAEGSSVITVGRRKENLEKFVHEHGKDKATAVPFDITKLDMIDNFVTNVTSTYPDLDCILLNAGIQRGVDFTTPNSISLPTIQEEYTTNYLAPLALTKAFLPFFQSTPDKKSALIYVTSSLALVPLKRCPNYCASKAALHHLILVLREQLRESHSHVAVVELLPPAVQTELHDAKHQPDIRDGRSIGMPLNEFIEEAYAGLAKGEEQVAVGMGKVAFDSWEQERQRAFLKSSRG